MLYILYSSNFLLKNDLQDCPTIREHLSNLLHANNSSQSLKHNSQNKEENKSTPPLPPTELKHIVFCMAGSSNLWEQRKRYIQTWWRPKETRGIIWLDKPVKTQQNEALPEIRISSNTSKFPYKHRSGKRSALRISRVVSETMRLGMKDVRWFVMGDDDTVFVVDNVVRVLAKYDHQQYYYVGSSSESHVQNIFFSYSMAYGGGGFAISYPLAKALEKMQDKCIHRYPGLYGSDDRIQACMAELGVPLTKESGFHQYDVYGNLLGLLGAHPVAPLVSLHHLDVVDPIFPHMSQSRAIQHLFESIKLDSSSVMQHSICYDKRHIWSISISWGYVVQIIRGVLSPRELEMPTRTFLNWYKRADYTAYSFNTRPVAKHPCQKPFIYYMNTVRYDRANKQTLGIYRRHPENFPPCRWKMVSPVVVDTVVIIKKTDPLRWQRSPRRDCCRVLPSKKSSTMYLSVGNCQEGELSEL
ncbi:Transferring glycosyl group transferase [Thalictrum thalictroides]|uniref:Transferring glycosyl group transferase n=1 Tax=Thalictrum thalictroides TaxID=46969 RepID=A0A7J6WMM6_THATH|nr:Transferring glycosyl group transferase [Thalictrum thalictroides]